MDKSTASGKLDQMKGKVKQSVGEAIGNDRMANSGTYDQVKGSAKEAWGETKDAARSNAKRDEAYERDAAEDRAHNLRDTIVSKAEEAKDAIKDRAERSKDRRVA